MESVIASLWKVPDNTTAPLMVEFYRIIYPDL
ncbi:MAG: CHAT domain-containing protein [Calothrix sp. SM1_7_51]|nr:CHAT domain-containing protein [Calothrix sp. SM1_7_51]